MGYYCIDYLYSEERNGIYHHLPVTTQYTTDKKTAQKWYEDAVRINSQDWRRNILIKQEERTESDKWFWKQSQFEIKEAGTLKGFYLIQLKWYNLDPSEFF